MPGSRGRRRKNDDAEAIEGLAADPRRPEDGAAGEAHTAGPVSPRPKGSRRRRPERPGKAGGSGDAGGSGRKSFGRAIPILLGALGVAVIALVVALVLQFMPGAAAPEQSRPVSYTVIGSGDGLNEALASQEVDSRPLNESEVFRDEEISSQGITFTLADRTFTEDCSELVWGEDLKQALADAGCTQAARGAYTSDDYVGLAVLFNLADTEGSRAVADAMELPDDPDSDAGGFVLTGAGDDEGTAALGAGYNEAEATVSGHYLLVTWAQPQGSTSAEEKESLSSPLIALSSFRDLLFRRMAQLEDAADTQAGEGADAG
ncbi:hypothetical protein HNR23_002428 [Nocardiopsis mwathae]|uniref:Uncharacterized protein n=1 Tax=Nocardiopsis mwathae TaxID=1472723 RepID=A0A7X0D5K9_9ACTN|nr:hypothetical protein [Nocardiopsis mwathae]MBB6172368.1 hypothetical protein [Nocardiopsis mwathae]